jgi:hypothetical protein
MAWSSKMLSNCGNSSGKMVYEESRQEAIGLK